MTKEQESIFADCVRDGYVRMAARTIGTEAAAKEWAAMPPGRKMDFREFAAGFIESWQKSTPSGK